MRWIRFFFAAVLVSSTLMGCAARKKRKCNTCPKWTQVTPAENSQILADATG